MKYDYIQVQTPADLFEFREQLLTPRKPTNTGISRRGFNIREISSRLNLPARFTNKLMVEVTGNAYVTLGIPATILGPDYFSLIDADNFEQCLQLLIDNGLFHAVDIKNVKNLSKVVRLDIAGDVVPTISPKKNDYYRFRFFLKNAFRWKRIEQHLNSFGSLGCKENFKIYGKTREMNLARHTRFKTENRVIVSENLVRLEYRLTSAEKVRKACGSKKLNDVLNCEKNVLSDLLRGVFVDINPDELYQIKMGRPFQKRLKIAEENNFDPINLEAIAQDWGKNHRSLRLRDINQAIIAAHKEFQKSGNILKELLELTTQN